MGLHLDGQHEIPARPAAAACIARTWQADLAADAHTGRDLDVEPLARDARPSPPQRAHGARRNSPLPPHSEQPAREDHVATATTHRARATAARTRHGAVRHLAAGLAVGARLEAHQVDAPARALHRLLEADAGHLLEILAPRGLGAARAGAGRHRRSRGSRPSRPARERRSRSPRSHPRWSPPPPSPAVPRDRTRPASADPRGSRTPRPPRDSGRPRQGRPGSRPGAGRVTASARRADLGGDQPRASPRAPRRVPCRLLLLVHHLGVDHVTVALALAGRVRREPRRSGRPPDRRQPRPAGRASRRACARPSSGRRRPPRPSRGRLLHRLARSLERLVGRLGVRRRKLVLVSASVFSVV